LLPTMPEDPLEINMNSKESSRPQSKGDSLFSAYTRAKPQQP